MPTVFARFRLNFCNRYFSNDSINVIIIRKWVNIGDNTRITHFELYQVLDHMIRHFFFFILHMISNGIYRAC